MAKGKQYRSFQDLFFAFFDVFPIICPLFGRIFLFQIHILFVISIFYAVNCNT